MFSFGDQAAQSVIGCGELFDETLPRAVQDDLLVCFFDGDKSNLGPGNGFADVGCIRSVVLVSFATHAVRGDMMRGHEFDCVAVLAE